MNQDIFQSKEFKENLKKYEVARMSGNSIYLEPDVLTDIAEYYHAHGNLDAALEAVDLALQMFPGAVEPLVFKARFALLLEEGTSQAMHYAQQIADKQDLEYYYLLAEIKIVGNRIDDAEKYLEEKESSIDADDLEDYRLDVATLFADYDIYDKAEKWLNLCAYVSEPDYQELNGRIEMNKGHYKKCENIFNKLLDKDPFHISYWNLLASAFYLENEISKSLDASDFALAIDTDDAEALLNKGNCLAMLGNYDEALEYYQRYETIQPHSEAGEMGIASILMAEEKFDEALAHWFAAEQLCLPQSGNLLDIYRNECLSYAMSGDFDNAFKCVNKLDGLASGETPETLVLRGYLSLLAKNQDVARQYFTLAYEDTEDGDKDNTLWFISNCYFECNFMQEAHDILRKLVSSEKSKNFTDLWAYLVRTDYELGLQEEFLADLKEATKRNPYGIQRELSDIFPKGMQAIDFYGYAVHHPINKKKR